MRRALLLASVVCTLVVGAIRPAAAATVFDGDPVDGGGRPFEILPGRPLVTAGPDGRLGTADDVVDASRVGDVDLVVRLGAVPATNAIPGSAKSRKAIATGTAGLRGAGVAIPFHAYLSDGAVGGGHPYGNLLAAPDMIGLPVIVMLFADRNGDGVIGPTGKDPKRDVRALAELEPVGTEVALFDATGQASGTIMATVGGPPSLGGVTLAATALAFTGAYDPAFFKGAVPTGPAITTAQPFIPERDPARIFTDPGPLTVDGTLNPRVRAAAIPDPKGAVPVALNVKTSPTIDTARAVAGPAVCARLVEPPSGKALASAPPSLALGTLSGAAHVKLMLVAVDRFGNPTDPAPNMVARVVADGPFTLTPDGDTAPASETIAITQSKGVKLSVNATAAGAGTVRVLVGGALCQRLAADARDARNKNGSDAVVALKGKATYRSVADAAALATDRDGDGQITIVVADGIYRETVPVDRAVAVIGAGSERTVIDARGLGAAVTIGSAGAAISGVTASGGTTGFSVAVPMTVSALDARGNVGAGITLATSGAAATACLARENGGAGFALAAPGTLTGNAAIDNAGPGFAVSTAGAGATIADNVATLNTLGGVSVLAGNAPVVTGNALGGNFGPGIELEETAGGTVTGNRAAGNEADGLRLNKSDGALIDGNDFSSNHGFGMRIDRSTADFDAAAGVQPPPGTNDVTGNRKGDVEIK